jgi:phosphoribosyl-dephospho-CoA transferase
MYKWNDDPLRVHDLALLKSSSISDACMAQPAWVGPALEKTPWVVVRREVAPTGKVAVGVRGEERHQRWGGFVARSTIVGSVRVDQLRSSQFDPSRRSLPALRALECVERRMESLNLVWGPMGSLGFELATGRHITRPASDLDLVIYAPQPLGKEEARDLWNRVRISHGKVDAKVETPVCGFSLQEYVNGQSSTILLRMPMGIRLGADPWAPPTEEGY